MTGIKTGEFVPDMAAAKREIEDRQTLRRLEDERRLDRQAEIVAKWPRGLRWLPRLFFKDRVFWWIIYGAGVFHGALWYGLFFKK